MTTLNTIWEEIQHVPVHRLDEVYHFVHSLSQKPKRVDEARVKEIMSYSGILSDMSEKDYQDYLKETRRVRKQLFKRKVKI